MENFIGHLNPKGFLGPLKYRMGGWGFGKKGGPFWEKPKNQTLQWAKNIPTPKGNFPAHFPGWAKKRPLPSSQNPHNQGFGENPQPSFGEGLLYPPSQTSEEGF